MLTGDSKMMFLKQLMQLVIVSIVLCNNPTSAQRILDHEMKRICYYPSWSQYRIGGGRFVVNNIDPDLCTHIVFAYAAINEETFAVQDYDANDADQLADLLALKQDNPDLEILLAVGGWPGDDIILTDIVSTATSRLQFIQGLVNYIAEHQLDGFVLHWTFPTGEERDMLRDLIQETRVVFEAFGGYLIGLDVGVREDTIVNYDFTGMEPFVDWFGLMTYDLAGGWDGKTGHHSPLFPSRFSDPTANQDWAVLWLRVRRVPPGKIVLGLATYGRSFSITHFPNETGLGVEATMGEAGIFAQEDGLLALYEVCYMVNFRDWELREDPVAMAAVAFDDEGQWVTLESVASVTVKCNYAVAHNLGGVTIMDLSTDDFVNYCGLGKFPLLNAITDILTDVIVVVPAITTTTTTTRRPTTRRTTTPTTTTRPTATQPTTTTTRPTTTTTRPTTTTTRPTTTTTRPTTTTTQPTTTTTTEPTTTTTRPTTTTTQPTTTTTQPTTTTTQPTTTTTRPTTTTTQPTTTTTRPTTTTTRPTTTTTTTTSPPPTTTTRTTTTTTAADENDIPAAELRRVCYYPSWSQYRAGPGHYDVTNIDPFLCTHLIFAFAAMNDVNFQVEHFDWNDGAQLSSMVRLKGQNPNLKVMVAIGGYNAGGTRFSNMASRPDRRATFISSLLLYLRENRLDGMDLDWEFPGSNDVQTLPTLMQEIKEAFLPFNYILSIGVGVGRQRLFFYDLNALEPYVDWFGLMAYDLAGSWDRKTGYHTALHKTFDGDTLNLVWVVDEFLWRQVSPNKMILGLATYGRSFSVTDPAAGMDPGVAATAGVEGQYTGTEGFLAYYEICGNVVFNGWTERYNNRVECVTAYSGTQWVGYDNVRSIRVKCEYALEQRLAGVMVWDLSMDDFMGSCGQGSYPLLNTIKSVLLAGGIHTHTADPDVYPIDFECPQASGLFGDPNNCSHFINCLDGEAFAINCPQNLKFNSAAGYCDRPENANC